MIDFVKIGVVGNDLAATLLANTDLGFVKEKDKQAAKWHNMAIVIHDSGRVEVSGSLHKFWNGGTHNYNDFRRVDLWDTIVTLCQRLNIDPQTALLHNVEFGVNLVVAFNVTDFLRGLITYKDESFTRVAITGKGYYKQAAKSRYLIKTYDKGKQHDRPDNILRFEIKVLKMEHLSKVGVRTLADLMDAQKLSIFGDLLAEAWNDCIVVEPLDRTLLTKPEQRIYSEATDSKTWDSLADKVTRCRLRKNYEKIILKYLSGGRKTEVETLIKNKWHDLLQLPKTCNELTDFQNHVLQPFNRSNIVLKGYNLESENIGDKKVYCLTTNVNIEHQKLGSKFVGEKTVLTSEYLTENLIDKRQKKKRKQHWRTADYYGAHNARNDFHNPKNNLQRRVERAKAQTLLFDSAEVIRLSEIQKQILGGRS